MLKCFFLRIYGLEFGGVKGYGSRGKGLIEFKVRICAEGLSDRPGWGLELLDGR